MEKTVWGQAGSGDSGGDRRKDTCPVQVATTGSTHMEVAALEKFEPFEALFTHLGVGTDSSPPLPVPPILITQIISGGVGFFKKFIYKLKKIASFSQKSLW